MKYSLNSGKYRLKLRWAQMVTLLSWYVQSESAYSMTVVLASLLCILVSCVTCVHNSLSISNNNYLKIADIDSSLSQSIEALGLCHREKDTAQQDGKLKKIKLLILESNEKYFETCSIQNINCWYKKALLLWRRSIVKLLEIESFFLNLAFCVFCALR